MRPLLLLSTLSLDVFQIDKIIHPIVNQTIDKIYDTGSNHSYIIYTNITSDTIHQLPILLYRRPHYIIITHSPIQVHDVNHEWQYKKDIILWYNHKEQQVKIWSIINHAWYESYDYPYRTIMS